MFKMFLILRSFVLYCDGNYKLYISFYQSVKIVIFWTYHEGIKFMENTVGEKNLCRNFKTAALK